MAQTPTSGPDSSAAPHSPKLDKDAITAALADRAGWVLADDGRAIEREFVFAGFKIGRAHV